MLFKYKATTRDGEERVGTIDAFGVDVAIGALQKRDLIIVSIQPADVLPFYQQVFASFQSVKTKDVVILSRQLATLFEAKVSVLDTFKLLSSETENALLRKSLSEITDDIQSGVPISTAMSKHPAIFSTFFVSLVRSGEESGKLPESFNYLADYLDRQFAIVSKAKSALIYPAFIVVSFLVVMVLMLVLVIPRLAEILTETGQQVPLYTTFVIGLSAFFVNYGIFIVVALLIGAIVLWRFIISDEGKKVISELQLRTPYIGTLYKRFYLSRIADNMDTLITSGVSMIRSLEITGDVVGSDVYKKILLDAVTSVKGGSPLSLALAESKDIPQIMVQMTKIGEETGNLGFVLKTMATFYKREVDNAVDTLVALIEPVMIVFLGVAVGLLLVSVLGPIYNITTGI
ncbi:MAG: type II secretion system F family protein [Candidatus Vogelbacteria bacterium]|nr:type II secretion system F family protein [Candidatus Vogelbacteria bacterium]